MRFISPSPQNQWHFVHLKCCATIDHRTDEHFDQSNSAITVLNLYKVESMFGNRSASKQLANTYKEDNMFTILYT